MKPAIASPIVEEYVANGRSESCPVIDAHAHMGEFGGIYFPNADAGKMLATMDRCGVRKVFFAHHRALRDSERGNADAEAAVATYPERLGAYWAVVPTYPERVKREVEAFDLHKGFVGYKILAGYYKVQVTHPSCRPLWEHAHEARLPVLLHTWGGDTHAGPEQITEIASAYPGATILMGHAQYGDWDGAIAMATKFDNVYIELTAAYNANGAIEKMVNAGCRDKILFGEDLPWFDPMYGIGCVIFSRIEDDARHAILHRNAERVFERWL